MIQSEDIRLHIPVWSEHEYLSILLDRIASQNTSVFTIHKSNAARCMAGNMNYIQNPSAQINAVPFKNRADHTRPFSVKCTQFRWMHIIEFERFISRHVVHIRVCVYQLQRQFCYFLRFRNDVKAAYSGVYDQSLLITGSKKNADSLKIAAVESVKESERGIVDIETLKKTNSELISTLDDVLKIQEEGRSKRAAAEAEMAKMENELKAKLLEISKTSK